MNRVILITGGSEGLGKSIAKILCDSEKIIILSHNTDTLQKTAEEIGCEYITCDVTKPEEIEKAVNEVIEKFGKIDVLINNAGIWIEGELETNDYETINKTIDVNTKGVIYFTKTVIPVMKKQGSGQIINIISQAGINTKPERSVYNASKWAITGFTKSLQSELAEFNIKVTGVYPGKLNTKLFEKSGHKKDMSDSLDPDVVAKTIEFILSFDDDTIFPEVGMKHIKN